MSKNKSKNSVVEWIDYRLPIFTFLNHELNEYPTPKKFKLLLEFWFIGWYYTCRNDNHWDRSFDELYSSCRLCV